LKALDEKKKALSEAAKRNLNTIALTEGVAFYDSVEFKTFLTAAEGYIRLFGEDTYPEEGEKCVYCQQPLEEKARELVSAYRKLLNDTTEEELKLTAQLRDDVVKTVSAINLKISLSFGSFGEDENGNALLPPELIEYNELIEKWRARLIATSAQDNAPAPIIF